MKSLLAAPTRWLHTMYPAGTVERLPVVAEDGTTAVPGVYVVGDLAGVPLLKFSQDTGAKAVQRIVAESGFRDAARTPGVHDIAIIGAGVSGIAAALEARRAGLDVVVLESSEPFSTIANFPRAKPIYLYPTEMQPQGELAITAQVKEPLLDELRAQLDASGIAVRSGIHATHVERAGGHLRVMTEGTEPIAARRVIVAIGRSGNFRRLDVPGEDLPKVSNRLYDPAEFAGRRVLVVGGGDSATEAAIALANAGASVTLSFRADALTRPKPENIEGVAALTTSDERVGRIRVLPASRVERVAEASVTVSSKATGPLELANDAVFVLIGREAPLDFFRRSGIPINGEWNARRLSAFATFLVFCLFLYNWKGGGVVADWFRAYGLFPFRVGEWLSAFSDPSTVLGTLRISMQSPSFYYTLMYSILVVVFGLRRIQRRKTPYVTAQTTTLAVIQVLPLFLLPEVILPLLGHNGAFDSGALRTIVDHLFPLDGSMHGREYWRSYGFILAWPLFVYNFFTAQPMAWWLAIGSIQTFVIIPAMVYFWGKGAYCGWICSCGALAETLGDEHRTKMPHGPVWSRLNLAGQVILWIAAALMVLRIVGWIFPTSFAAGIFDALVGGHGVVNGREVANPVNYKWIVDTALSGIVGVGFYFWYSGRVWCRFFCPLAALMHVYAKFSRFRILAEKKKCISCNVCTSVCHQGIDVMSFANRGIPMEDPECVRCSACVQSCPTGVLRFGQIDGDGNVVRIDALAASPVLMREAATQTTKPTTR